MTPNQQKIIELLTRAKQEGIDETLAQQAASQQAEVVPQPSPAADMPIHNTVNPIIDAYFKSLPEMGYKYNDVSRIWYYYKFVRPSSTKNMADRSNPYLVFARGDSLLLECDGLPSQTILPKNNVFECYQLLPGKVYHWSVSKAGKVIDKGEFKTIGDFRFINIPTWPNVRDIGYANILEMDRVLRAANPDNVEVGSADYDLIKSLGIDFQLNLRTPKAGSSQDKPWRPDLFPRGCNNNIADYSNILTKPTGWKTAIETLITELKAGHRVVFNCFAGADRTGSFCYILQGICGVPKRIAQGFYESTSFLYWENFLIWDEEGEDYFRLFDKDLEKRFGPDFYTQCYCLLTEVVGITPAQIKELQQELMVDPSSAPTPILG